MVVLNNQSMKIWGKACSILFLTLLSCGKHQEYEQIINKMIGREINFPNPIYTIMGNDTLFHDLDNYEYKILSYVDSKGCTECKMKLEEWKIYISMVDSLYKGRVGFVFYYTPESKRTVNFLLEKHQFDYPVIIDTTNVFERRNPIPDNYMLQTFLLDGENKIVAVGNPIINNKIKTLYNRIFSNVATTNLLPKSERNLHKK